MTTRPKRQPAKKAKMPFVLPQLPRATLPEGFKPMRIEDIWGKGKDLWASDEELDQFLATIRKMRKS